MRLTKSLSADEQIRAAIAHEIPICMDVRGERMGDKVAVVGFASWLQFKYQVRITIVEASPGRTDFLLSDYVLPAGIDVVGRDPYEPIEDMLDVHTAGNQDSLWILNPYMAAIGWWPEIKLRTPLQQVDNVVIGGLLNVEYNNRRGMQTDCLRFTIDHLKSVGLNVTLLLPEKNEFFPEAIVMPTKTAVEIISQASVFIGGDTGFTHLAAALGVPVVGIYPDWWMHQVPRLGDAIVTAEWWGLPTMYTPKSFLPNAPPWKLKVVELASDNTWSIEHVIRSVQSLREPDARAPA